MSTYGRIRYCKDVKCPVCGKQMYLDDIDYNFKGNQNEYWCCPDDECRTSAYARIRYSQVIDIEYMDTDANVIKKRTNLAR